MSTQTQNLPARVDPGLVALSELLNRAKNQISLALPKHLTAERMIRMCMTLYSKNDQLRKCTPASILACVVQSSELGLELSSPLGHGFMVPYGTTATFQIGYKGFFELAFRSGRVSAFPMRTVYANDVFKVRYGTNQGITHEPKLSGDRGSVIGYYAAIYMRDGGRDFEWMSVEDVNAHEKRFVKNTRRDGPWATARDAMAMKTCVRMLAKRVPVSTELNSAAAIDENQEAGLPLEIDLGEVGRSSQVAAALAGNGNGNGHDDSPDAIFAAIEAEFARTGASQKALKQKLGVKDLKDMTPAQCEQCLAELRAMPNAREPGGEG